MIKMVLDAAIDSFQSSKKMFVDTFVKHDTLAKTLNDFVDNQTEYTKKAVTATLEAGNAVVHTITDKKFYEEVSNVAKNHVKDILDTKKGK